MTGVALTTYIRPGMILHSLKLMTIFAFKQYRWPTDTARESTIPAEE